MTCLGPSAAREASEAPAASRSPSLAAGCEIVEAVGALADHSHLGDPLAMEQLATELTQRAEAVAEVGRSLERQATSVTFKGPAAERMRADMRRRHDRARSAAERLQNAAHALRRGAASAREQIYELELAERKRRDEESS